MEASISNLKQGRHDSPDSERDLASMSNDDLDALFSGKDEYKKSDGKVEGFFDHRNELKQGMQDVRADVTEAVGRASKYKRDDLRGANEIYYSKQMDYIKSKFPLGSEINIFRSNGHPTRALVTEIKENKGSIFLNVIFPTKDGYEKKQMTALQGLKANKGHEDVLRWKVSNLKDEAEKANWIKNQRIKCKEEEFTDPNEIDIDLAA